MDVRSLGRFHPRPLPVMMDDPTPMEEQLREAAILIDQLESEITDLKQRLADRQRRLTEAREEIAELRQRNIRLENDNG